MSRGWLRGGSALVVALVAGGTASCGSHGPARQAAFGGVSPSSKAHRTLRLGTSVRGRPVDAVELGDPTGSQRVLLVGCIHGDEPAGIAIAQALAAGPAPVHADLWIVPVLNPDGVAAGTRGNGQGVDLNRNFPDGWRPLGSPGDFDYSGKAALSEPESRSVAALVRQVRPTVGIWFHQHLAVVDTSQGPKEVEQRFARQVGLPARPLTDYPGSATGWENTVVPDSAFVVELPAGSLSPPDVRRYVAAVQSITGP